MTIRMLAQDYIGLLLVYLIIAASLAVALHLDRRGSSIDSRKVVHIGVGLFVFVWWAFTERWVMLAFFTVPFAVILFFAMFSGNMVSRSRIGTMAQDRGHRTGLFLYAVSITVLVLFFFGDHWVAASIGVIALTWGDGMGSIIGKRYGTHGLSNGKSLEGSLGVFAGTAAMTLVLMLFYGCLASSGLYSGDVVAAVPVPVVCLASGLVATLVEALSPGAYDNLAIPIIVAAAMVPLGL